MTVESEILAIKEQRNQLNAALEVRKDMNRVYTAIVVLEAKVDKLIEENSFDLIPTETKQALNQLYQMYIQLKTALEAHEHFDILIRY